MLEPTKANEHGKYKAPDATTPTTKAASRTTQVSEHLLAPTKAVENAKYKAPETSSTPKTSPRNVVVSERLLTPTKATEHGQYKKPVKVDDSHPRESGWNKPTDKKVEKTIPDETPLAPIEV